MGFQLWENLLLSRVMPSVSSSVAALLVVFLCIRLFRVTNPQTRYVLLHLPLIKGLLVLIRGVPMPVPGASHSFRFGIQLMDPLSLIQMPSYRIMSSGLQIYSNELGPSWDSGLVELAFVVAMAAAAGLLLYRWVGLVLFYRRLLSGVAETRESAPQLFDMLDRLVPAFRVTYPRVVLVDDPPIAPCTVGIRPPTILLSSPLLKDLDEAEMEAVLAHELAHVARRDGLLHWPSLLLRDLQAFNPFAHRLFNRSLVEREKATDQTAARATGNPQSLAKALVDVALLARGAELRAAPGSVSLRQNLMGRTPVVEERVSALLAQPIAASRLRVPAIALLFLLLMLVRVFVSFSIAGRVIMLE